MSRPHPVAGVAWFLLKFCLIVPVLLVLWWIVQPYYVRAIGQIAGVVIRYFGNLTIEGMRVEVDESGVLNTRTSLVYLFEGRRYPIEVAFLIANLPAYLALVLATSGLAWRRRLRAMALGSGILAVGHVLFLSIMFIFARQVQAAPEIPTAFGMFVMTLPFPLWIVFAYWDKVLELFEGIDSAGAQGADKKNPPDPPAEKS